LIAVFDHDRAGWLRAVENSDPALALALERLGQLHLMGGSDAIDGVKALLERRDP
jgi:hypothetical protein